MLSQLLPVSLLILGASIGGFGPTLSDAFYRPSHAFALTGLWAETLESEFGLVTNGTMSLAYRVKSNLTAYFESTYLLFLVVDAPQREGWYLGLSSGPLSQDEARAYCGRPATFRMHAQQQASYMSATSSSGDVAGEGEGGFTFVAPSTARYSAYMLQCSTSAATASGSSNATASQGLDQDLVVELEYFMANPTPDADIPLYLNSNSQFDYTFSDSGYLSSPDGYTYLPIQNVPSPGVAAVLIALYVSVLVALLAATALR
jgi:hypothetical protein